LAKPIDLLYLSANSFNPKAAQSNEVSVFYSVTADTRVTIRIYSVSGTLVRTIRPEQRLPGFVYNASWNGRGEDGRLVASGLYLIHVEAGGYKQLKKVIVLTW
jgi:flagellar hook assembly protein FlgD